MHGQNERAQQEHYKVKRGSLHDAAHLTMEPRGGCTRRSQQKTGSYVTAERADSSQGLLQNKGPLCGYNGHTIQPACISKQAQRESCVDAGLQWEMPSYHQLPCGPTPGHTGPVWAPRLLKWACSQGALKLQFKLKASSTACVSPCYPQHHGLTVAAKPKSPKQAEPFKG